jgi:hypothetical protein
MHFRVEGMIPADSVPDFRAVPSIQGQVILTIADVDGPVTNYTYRPDVIAPHLGAIREAIKSKRVYSVETDSTAMTWPHNPDPRGYNDQRILRAIAEQRESDDDPR